MSTSIIVGTEVVMNVDSLKIEMENVWVGIRIDSAKSNLTKKGFYIYTR